MYSRRIDGQELTLQASGWTYKRLFVLWDIETETMWYHLPGTEGLTGIAGHHKGRVLPIFPTQYVPWFQWKQDHPSTQILRTRGRNWPE